MALSNINILAAICKLLVILMVKGDGIDKSQCLSLGFTPDLICSSCDKLSDFNLEILEDDCKNCCQPDSEDVVVKYVRGKDPTVLLLDENREVQETLSVEKWDTDNIEEFFTEKLKL